MKSFCLGLNLLSLGRRALVKAKLTNPAVAPESVTGRAETVKSKSKKARKIARWIILYEQRSCTLSHTTPEGESFTWAEFRYLTFNTAMDTHGSGVDGQSAKTVV